MHSGRSPLRLFFASFRPCATRTSLTISLACIANTLIWGRGARSGSERSRESVIGHVVPTAGHIRISVGGLSTSVVRSSCVQVLPLGSRWSQARLGGGYCQLQPTNNSHIAQYRGCVNFTGSPPIYVRTERDVANVSRQQGTWRKARLSLLLIADWSDKWSPKQAAHAATCAASLGLQPERVDARRRGTRAAVQPFRRDIGVRALMAHDGGGGVA